MSRTYRRKSGAKWWRAKDNLYIRDIVTDKAIDNPSSQQIDAYAKKMVSIYEGRDYYSHPGVSKDLLKWHGNLLRRSCRREEISKVMRLQDYEDANYDNTKELYVKCLRWMYD